MPELKGREKDEQELAALLLLLFASEDMPFWLADLRAPDWFATRLRNLRLQDRLLGISIRARQTMLAELRVEVDRILLDRRMATLTDFYRHDLASRLAHRHAAWLRQLQEEARERERRRQAGEDVPEPDGPKPEDIYGDAFARREAASAITDWVSQTEFETADEIARIHGKTLEAIWQTEADPCPICAELSGKPASHWRKKFPRGPKAHPNCVLPETAIQTPFGLTASMKSHFRGEVRDLCIGGYRILSVTAQHPIETPLGPIPAGNLKSGDTVFTAQNVRDCAPCVAERIHRGMLCRWDHEPLSVVPEPGDLHGEGKFITGRTEIAGKPAQPPPIDDMSGAERFCLEMRRRSIRPHVETVTFNSRRFYDGLVYDFSAQSAPYYVAAGIFVSNCRCWLTWKEVLED